MKPSSFKEAASCVPTGAGGFIDSPPIDIPVSLSYFESYALPVVVIHPDIMPAYLDSLRVDSEPDA